MERAMALKKESPESDDKEPGQTQLRTTEAQIFNGSLTSICREAILSEKIKEGRISPKLSAFEKGCPQCGEIPVVTKTRLFPKDQENVEIRNCYCRVCNWSGQLQRTL